MLVTDFRAARLLGIDRGVQQRLRRRRNVINDRTHRGRGMNIAKIKSKLEAAAFLGSFHEEQRTNDVVRLIIIGIVECESQKSVHVLTDSDDI